jgi:hypothetical protein
VVKHSHDKDQFLRVSLKQMQETQMYENELKEANEYISTLATRLEELKAKCTEETHLKEGKILPPLCLLSSSYLSTLWIDHNFHCSIKDQLLALGVLPGAPGTKTQALANLKADLVESQFRLKPMYSPGQFVT